MLRSLQRNLSPMKIKSIGQAMDIVVIEQPDGSLLGSPFYLRVSRSYVFTALNVTVDLIVNDKHIQGIKMRPTASGLCHFEINSDKNEQINRIANNASNVSVDGTKNGFNRNNERYLVQSPYPPTRISRNYDADQQKLHVKRSKDKGGMLRSFSLPDLYATRRSSEIYQSDVFWKCETAESVNKSVERLDKLSQVQPHILHHPFDRTRYSLSYDETHYHSILDKKRMTVSVDYLRDLSEENDLETLEEDSNFLSADTSDGEPCLPSGILDLQKDVNGILNVDSMIHHIEMCVVRPCESSDRLMDVTRAEWKKVDSKSANIIHEPCDALSLVRLTLEDGSQHYFTTDFLRENPINLDMYRIKDHVGCTRISYSKYISLTSYYLKNLNLLNGQNQLQYVIRSSKGPGFASANIYKWKFDDKLVVSDIDGTVTKSDLLGHLFGLVGMDYSHYGVAHLFSKIIENGYKLLFLSSRPLVQMRMTRNYLNRIKEGKWRIPQGPIILSTGSIFSVIHDELFNREKVRDLKANALDRIGHLFPQGYQPFHAAFGNADSDFKAYRLTGIPMRRIFLIGIDGKVVIGKKQKVQSDHNKSESEPYLNYSSLAELGNLVFPNLSEEVKFFDDYEDMLLWYTSLNPLVEFR